MSRRTKKNGPVVLSNNTTHGVITKKGQEGVEGQDQNGFVDVTNNMYIILYVKNRVIHPAVKTIDNLSENEKGQE